MKKVFVKQIEWHYVSQLIFLIAKRVSKIIAAKCENGNITIAQHHILVECFRMGNECGQEDLVSATFLNKGTISRGCPFFRRTKIPYNLYQSKRCG